MSFIMTDEQYEGLKRSLSKSDKLIKKQRKEYRKQGFSRKESKKLSTSTITRLEMAKEELAFYEKLKAGKLPKNLQAESLGRVLIYLRIASGMSQVQLAAVLGEDARKVETDERNEYHGVTLPYAQRVLNAIGAKIKLKIKLPKKQKPGA